MHQLNALVQSSSFNCVSDDDMESMTTGVIKATTANVAIICTTVLLIFCGLMVLVAYIVKRRTASGKNHGDER
mgnify:CR=1 FL=1